MAEMSEPIWALLSERGCEAAGVTYDEAHTLMLKLRAERVNGLCIITDRAARFVPRVKKNAQISTETLTTSKG